MVKRPGLGKRKRFPQAEESETPDSIAATDSTKSPDESVSTQSALVNTHPAVTTQSAQDDYESQTEDTEGELLTQKPTQQSNELVHKKKLVRLTDEQEEAIADWLKNNTVLYNKGKNEYRDVDKKEALWAALPRLMGISGDFCLLYFW